MDPLDLRNAEHRGSWDKNSNFGCGHMNCQHHHCERVHFSFGPISMIRTSRQPTVPDQSQIIQIDKAIVETPNLRYFRASSWQVCKPPSGTRRHVGATRRRRTSNGDGRAHLEEFFRTTPPRRQPINRAGGGPRPAPGAFFQLLAGPLPRPVR